MGVFISRDGRCLPFMHGLSEEKQFPSFTAPHWNKPISTIVLLWSKKLTNEKFAEIGCEIIQFERDLNKIIVKKRNLNTIPPMNMFFGGILFSFI